MRGYPSEDGWPISELGAMRHNIVFPPGHAGLSVAAAIAVGYALGFGRGGTNSTGRRGSPPQGLGSTDSRGTQRLGDILRSIDARLVIIGSLAPDILDRPLGMWVLPESLDPTSRGFGHVLLVNVLLIVLSVVVLRWTGLRAPLVFFLAAAGHMLLDRMWESLDTVLWPIRGTSFGAAEYDLSPSWLHWLQSGASSFVPEALGALVLVIVGVWLYRRRTLINWLRTGVG